LSTYAHDLSGYARPDKDIWLSIQRRDIQRVLLDELASRLDLVAHQPGEDLVGVGLVPQLDAL